METPHAIAADLIIDLGRARALAWLCTRLARSGGAWEAGNCLQLIAAVILA